MSIAEENSFDKDRDPQKLPWLRQLFLSLVIILVALISFGLGRLSGGGEREGLKLEYDANLTQPAQALQGVKSTSSNVIKAGEVVGSSKGSKYHYPHCPGAKQISEGNRVVFASASAAEASGYTLASNCRPQ